MSSDADHRHKFRFWRLLRIYFRRFRITVWLALLLIVGVFVYLNQIGLPDFVKKPLLESLRARGIDLQFSRLRLDWADGIVADHVRFGRPDNPESPYLTVREVKVGLDRSQLAKLTLQIESLTLRNGNLVWPLPEPNKPSRQLALQNIETDLRFLPGDHWELDNFRATFTTANIRFPAPSPTLPPFAIGSSSSPRSRFRRRSTRGCAGWPTCSTASHFRPLRNSNWMCRGTPAISRAFPSACWRLPLARTLPGALSLKAGFRLKLHPPTNQVSHAELNLEALNAQTRWGNLTNLILDLQATSSLAGTNLVQGEIKLIAGRLDTRWVSTRNTRVTGSWNPLPDQSGAPLRRGRCLLRRGLHPVGQPHQRPPPCPAQYPASRHPPAL